MINFKIPNCTCSLEKAFPLFSFKENDMYKCDCNDLYIYIDRSINIITSIVINNAIDTDSITFDIFIDNSLINISVADFYNTITSHIIKYDLNNNIKNDSSKINKLIIKYIINYKHNLIFI